VSRAPTHGLGRRGRTNGQSATYARINCSRVGRLCDRRRTCHCRIFTWTHHIPLAMNSSFRVSYIERGRRRKAA
jgi:hypothetical protein